VEGASVAAATESADAAGGAFCDAHAASEPASTIAKYLMIVLLENVRLEVEQHSDHGARGE
jgi:hypothetical protein